MRTFGTDYENHFPNSQSLKAYLNYQSKKHGIDIERTYEHYFNRKFLERLDAVNYGNLLLKGSFSQYIHLGHMTRPTTDIDLAGINDAKENLDVINQAVFSSFIDGLLFYYSKDIKKSPTGILNVKLKAEFDGIIQPISIDLMNNYKRYYEIQYKEVPCTFDYDNPFYFNTLSHEEHLAEKLCIIAESIKPDVLNTRVKDFYDMYQLHGGKYDYNKFSLYFYRMLQDRGKLSLNQLSTEHLNPEFIIRHQALWDAAVKRYGFMDRDIDLVHVVYYTRAVLAEQIQKIRAMEAGSGRIRR